MEKSKIFNSYKETFEKESLSQFDSIMAFQGEVSLKANKHRSVVRFSLNWNGAKKDFYLKRHFFPEIKDKIKDLLSFHWPLSDGKQELINIQRIDSIGIDTMTPVGWGEAPGFLRRKSFLMTESLGDLERLEDYFTKQFKPPLTKSQVQQKRALIEQVAQLAASLHQARFCHRDFYCGHILVKEQVASSPILYLIDLQRVRKHRYLRRRWRTKDLAALYYTASPEAITRTDRLRFFRSYLGLTKKVFSLSQHRWIEQIIKKSSRMQSHTDKKRERYLRQ